MPFSLLSRLLARLVCRPLSFAQQASIASANDAGSTAYGRPKATATRQEDRVGLSILNLDPQLYCLSELYNWFRLVPPRTRCVWLIVIGLASIRPGLAQQTPTLPKVIPPSPEAATLFRFLDYPVNSTGVPDISIPIYEVKSGALSVPITLSYHAGGRRTSDETGAAGLGWALHAGGMIARTVYGAPDDSRSFPSSLTPENLLSNATSYQYLKELYSESNVNGWDSEYDIFSYYFGTKSGKFVMNPQRDSVCLIPEAPLQFSGNSGSQGFPSSVLDEKGNLFEFGQEDERANVPGYGTYLTGRLLTRIISANKQDTVTFRYRGRSHRQANSVAEISIVDINETQTYTPGGQYPTYVQRTNTLSTQYTGVQRLQLIRFREGYLKFNPYINYLTQTGRADTTDQIASIQLFSRQGQLVKTVALQMSPLGFNNAGPVSKLDQLLFKNRVGETVEHYSFDYYPETVPNNTSAANGVDFWGFYNGYGYNTYGPIETVPSYTISVMADQYGLLVGQPYNITFGGANRQPNYLYALSGVLRRITYPTSGSTEFIYEGNRALRNSTVYDCPGLRVAQTTTRDTIGGPPQVRMFRYGPLVNGVENGYGERAYLTTAMEDMSYEMRYFPYVSQSTPSNPNSIGGGPPGSSGWDFASYRRRTYSSRFLPGIEGFANEPTFYTTITEYRGTPVGSAGKTTYSYSAPPINYIAHYSKPSYPGTLPIGGSANGAPSQVRHTWDYSTDGDLRVPYVFQFNQWNRSQLTEKTEYKYVSASNSYQRVHATAYVYRTVQTKVLRGQHLYRNIVVGNLSPYNPFRLEEQYMAEVCGMPLFSFADYYVTTGKVQLERTNEVFYDEAATFAKTTTSTYNDYQLPKRQEVTANGKTLITQTTYPFDTPTTPVHQQMLDQHQLDYPVEQRTYAGLQPLTTTATQYQPVTRNGVTFFAPVQVLTATGTDPLRPRLLFDDWDSRGNVTDQHQQLGTPEAYRWGYDGRYPVAHLVNARHRPTTGSAEFYAETFEEHPTRSTSHAQTGKYGSNGNAFPVPFFPPAGRSYVLDWQQWDNGHWVYHREPYVGKTFAAGTYVDDVRVYPVDAQISTYTYEPLVGVTSVTDTNGRSTRYEYDAYGRLSRVRNHLGQILSQQQYHYLGLP